MKKITIIVMMILVLSIAFTGCGKKVEEVEATPTPTIQIKTEEKVELSGKLIGLSLSENNDFNREFQKQFEQAFVNSDYDVFTVYAEGDYNKQVADLADMLNKVEILVLDPTDLDNLEYVLSEYEINETPVVNLTESVNAYTKMLIGPFYRDMGKEIGNHTFNLLAKATNKATNVAILRGRVDSSKMQGIYDGVLESLSDYKYTTVIEAPACNYDYERTKENVKRILQENAKVYCIFAETSQMAIAAIDAIDESGKSGVFITTIGADKECLKLVEDGRIDATIFYGPNDMAATTATYVNRILEDKEVLLPQFVELNYEIITKKNVANYYNADGEYALAANATELPPDPTPVVVEQETSEEEETEE